MKKLVLFLTFVLVASVGSTHAQTAPAARTVTAAEARELLAQPGMILLDVRTPKEFDEGHLRGARNLNFLSTEFPDLVAKLDPNARYVLYCKSGNRSSQAAALMLQNGFKHVVNAGGFTTLKEGGVPAE